MSFICCDNQDYMRAARSPPHLTALPLGGNRVGGRGVVGNRHMTLVFTYASRLRCQTRNASGHTLTRASRARSAIRYDADRTGGVTAFLPGRSASRDGPFDARLSRQSFK